MNCPNCGSQLSSDATFCGECGSRVQQAYEPATGNVSAYSAQAVTAAKGTKSKTTAGILAILLGGFGGQFFYLGHIGAGIGCILLLFTGFGWIITEILGVIQGIVMLTKSDEDFQKTWVEEKKLLF